MSFMCRLPVGQVALFTRQLSRGVHARVVSESATQSLLRIPLGGQMVGKEGMCVAGRIAWKRAIGILKD